jgi:hypothetical protein
VTRIIVSVLSISLYKNLILSVIFTNNMFSMLALRTQ